MKKHIPNAVTLMNLLSGSVGVIFLFKGNIFAASAMIFLAAIFDFFDGFLARLLGAYSEIGKSLDSLADMISFGLLPGLIVYSLQMQLNTTGACSEQIYAFSGLMIPALSALRLAIFNNDEEQKYVFRGLPTPANALFFAAAGITFAQGGETWIPFNHVTLLVLTIIFSFLLVSRLKMIAFKFSDYSLKNNTGRYTFLASSLVLLIIFRVQGIAMAVMLYILFSLASALFAGRNHS
jgi:CDP-diacylglycerol--serine O-phosphatidyltransferase